LLTAYWTQRRLSQELGAAKVRLAEQLAAETERQAQQLAAEQQRLQLQLEHERERLDLVDLRAVLEEALAASDAVFAALRLAWHGKIPANEAKDAIGPFSAQLDRLHIRLGHFDPIVTAHTKIGNALIEMRQLIDESYVGYETDPSAAEPPLPEDVAHWDDVLIRWHAAYHEYVDFAAQRVGSRLPQVAAS
jgi:hypothetical protein